jgi:hypothetical protein
MGNCSAGRGFGGIVLSTFAHTGVTHTSVSLHHRGATNTERVTAYEITGISPRAIAPLPRGATEDRSVWFRAGMKIQLKAREERRAGNICTHWHALTSINAAAASFA